MQRKRTAEEDAELMKCSIDPIFFVNGYCYAYDITKDRQANIQCFEYQERVLDDYLDHRWNVILKSRQTGLSVITACYVAWRLIFGLDETVIIIANNEDSAIRFLAHVRNVMNNLPAFIFDPAIDEVSSAAKKIEMTNGNVAKAKAAGKNAGRGDSPTLLVLDEWAFAKDDNDIWTAAAGSLAQTLGDCIVISTPNGTGNLYHQWWVKAAAGKGSFNPIKVHWTENPKSSVGLEMRADSKGILKPWSPWYEERCQEYDYDPVKIAQELDLSFEGSKLLALDPDEIARHRNHIQNKKIQPVMYFDFDVIKNPLTSSKTPCHLFKMPKNGAKYVLAADVAYQGVDFSTIQVIDADTLEQVAEYQGKCDPDVFAGHIGRLGKFYNNAFVAVEANNHGLVTCFKLRDNGYPNLFYTKSIKDIHVRWIDYKVEKGEGIPGFQTTAKTRPSVVNAIRQVFRETDAVINSIRLVDEMQTFIRNTKKGGREEAEQGYNDDLVMAYGIALYIRQTEYYNVLNAKDMYKSMLEAIDFSTSSYEGRDETAEEKAERMRQAKDFEENFIPPGAGGLWLDNNTENDEDDPNNIGWLLG